MGQLIADVVRAGVELGTLGTPLRAVVESEVSKQLEGKAL